MRSINTLGERSLIFVSISRSTVEMERDVVPRRIIYFTACTLVRLLGVVGHPQHMSLAVAPGTFFFCFM